MPAASGPNSLHTDQMTAQERLDEVAGLLALAVIRRHFQQIRTPTFTPSSAPEPLASVPSASVHGLETLSEEETRP